jgi:hypothetical protein
MVVRYKIGYTVKRTDNPTKYLGNTIWTVTATRDEEDSMFGQYYIHLNLPDAKAKKKWWIAGYFTKVNKRIIPWL